MDQEALSLSKRLQFSLDNPEAAIDSDAAILTRYVEQHDQDAFAQLVSRHGPVVWGVCRRQLIHRTDAEDVFQATFLVLTQQAGQIRRQSSLASWLHGVAWRIARKLKRTRIRRHQREQKQARSEAQFPDSGWDEALSIVLEAELARLPAEYREPVLLCYLHGQTQARAAQMLGWPIGTVAGRLSRGRELLRTRLLRRGVTPALIASLAVEQASAHVPARLVEMTMKTIQSGGTNSVVLLAEGGLVNMWMSKWLMFGALAACLTLGIGVGYSAWSGRAEPQNNLSATASPISQASSNYDQHPDFQAIQGRWRCETRNEVTDRLLGVQELTFRGKKYVRTAYKVEKNGIVSDSDETSAMEFVLDPRLRHLELQEWDVRENQFPPGQQLNDDFTERSLCNYELKGDALTIVYGGRVPFIRNEKGEVVPNRKSPLARFPDENTRTTKMVYQRVKEEKPETGSAPQRNNAKEQTEKRRLLNERVQAGEMVFKLRFEAYKSGKETINFLLESVRDRLDSKLEQASNAQDDTRAIIQEALDDARKIEEIAQAKYKTGSATLLEYSTAQYARLGYELKLMK